MSGSAVRQLPLAVTATSVTSSVPHMVPLTAGGYHAHRSAAAHSGALLAVTGGCAAVSDKGSVHTALLLTALPCLHLATAREACASQCRSQSCCQ